MIYLKYLFDAPDAIVYFALLREETLQIVVELWIVAGLFRKGMPSQVESTTKFHRSGYF
jgi:hypothetical protein